MPDENVVVINGVEVPFYDELSENNIFFVYVPIEKLGDYYNDEC